MYNFGLALFKEKKYLQAFKNFEKASNSLRGNPKLWYYLGLSVLHLNKEMEATLNTSEQKAGTFQQMTCSSSTNYEKVSTFS